MKLKDKNGVTIEITNDEILAQISEKERFNLASKLLINKWSSKVICQSVNTATKIRETN